MKIDIETQKKINKIIGRYPHSRMQYMRSDVDKMMVDLAAELQQADVVKSVCPDGHVWNTSLHKINNRRDYCVRCGTFK